MRFVLLVSLMAYSASRLLKKSSLVRAGRATLRGKLFYIPLGSEVSVPGIEALNDSYLITASQQRQFILADFREDHFREVYVCQENGRPGHKLSSSIVQCKNRKPSISPFLGALFQDPEALQFPPRYGVRRRCRIWNAVALRGMVRQRKSTLRSSSGTAYCGRIRDGGSRCFARDVV